MFHTPSKSSTTAGRTRRTSRRDCRNRAATPRPSGPDDAEDQRPAPKDGLHVPAQDVALRAPTPTARPPAAHPAFARSSTSTKTARGRAARRGRYGGSESRIDRFGHGDLFFRRLRRWLRRRRKRRNHRQPVERLQEKLHAQHAPEIANTSTFNNSIKGLFVVLKRRRRRSAQWTPAPPGSPAIARREAQHGQQPQPRADQGVDHVERGKRDAQREEKQRRNLQRAGEPQRCAEGSFSRQPGNIPMQKRYHSAKMRINSDMPPIGMRIACSRNAWGRVASPREKRRNAPASSQSRPVRRGGGQRGGPRRNAGPLGKPLGKVLCDIKCTCKKRGKKKKKKKKKKLWERTTKNPARCLSLARRSAAGFQDTRANALRPLAVSRMAVCGRRPRNDLATTI